MAECELRQLVGREEAKLEDVVGRLGRTVADPRAPVEVQRGDLAVARAVPVHEDPDELGLAEADPRFLAELAVQRVDRVPALLDEPAGEIPLAGARLGGAPAEHNSAVVVDDESRSSRLRIRVRHEATLPALDLHAVRANPGAAPRTVPPGLQVAHGPQQ